MKIRKIIMLLFFVMCFGTGNVKGEFIYESSSLWTGYSDVQVVGTKIYCSLRNGIQIIDVTDPENPVLTRQIYFQGEGNALCVSGDYVYLADGSAGLRIMDAEEPYNAYSIQLEGKARDIVVMDSQAYIASEEAGLQIVDISEPSAPALIGSYDTPDAAMALALRDGFAFVADSIGGLQIIDISDPFHPSLCAAVADRRVFDIGIEGQYAYVANDSGGFVYDITNPCEPIIGDYLGPTSAARIIEVHEGRLYFWGNGPLKIYDLSDPAHPAQIGAYSTLLFHRMKNIFASGEIIYFTLTDEIWIMSFSNPPEVRFIARCCGAESWLEVLGAQNNNLFACGGSQNLHVFDLATPSTPSEIYNIETGYIRAISLDSNYAYTADGAFINVWDISDLQFPYWLGGDSAACIAITDIQVNNNYVYLAAYSALIAYDISDPNFPTEAGIIDTPGDPLFLTFEGSYAYIGAREYLSIVDISDPSNMAVTGFMPVDFLCCEIKVRGDYAYYAAGLNGLEIANISDPANPVFVSRAEIAGMGNYLSLSGNYAFIGAGVFGISAVNIADPANPNLITYYDTPGIASEIIARDNYIYIADVYSIITLSFNSDCGDIAGDANNDLEFNGLDVVFSVRYLKGAMDIVPCLSYCNDNYGYIYKNADSNGNCIFNGLDITYSVNYLKNGISPPEFCAECE